MSKKSPIKLTASRLRIVLSLSLLIVAAIAGSVFIYGQGILKDYAIEVSHKKVDADASNGSIQALKTMQQELEKNKDVAEKIDSLKASNELPQFRIVDDVTEYAKKNSISIANFDFAEAAGATPAAGATTPPAAATTTPSATGTAAQPGQTASVGKSVSIIVTLNNPVNYLNLLQFIYDIEQNVPKMQISGISLGAAEKSNSKVTTEPVTIQMYTK